MIKKLSVVVNGHRTGISLEPEFLRELKLICARRRTTPSAIVSQLDDGVVNLSSAVRLFVLAEVKKRGEVNG